MHRPYKIAFPLRRNAGLQHPGHRNKKGRKNPQQIPKKQIRRKNGISCRCI